MKYHQTKTKTKRKQCLEIEIQLQRCFDPPAEKRDFLAPSIPFVLPDTTSRIPPRRSNEGQTTHLGELVKNVEFLLPPWHGVDTRVVQKMG